MDKTNSASPYQHIIPLHNYKLQHSPLSSSSKKKRLFIGRDKEVANFLNILNATKQSRGSYLISGYRGVGKTTFVNEVLSRYQEKRKLFEGGSKFIRIVNILFKIRYIIFSKYKDNTIQVKINLGSESKLEATKIMSNMTTLLRSELELKVRSTPFTFWIYLLPGYKRFKYQLRWLRHVFTIFLPLSLVVLSINLYLKNKDYVDIFTSELIKDISKSLAPIIGVIEISNEMLLVFVLCIIPVFPFVFKVILKELRYLNYSTAIVMLRKLELDIKYDQEITVDGKAGFFSGKLKGSAIKVDANSIENSLKIILEKCKFEGLDVIFIFDELDKLTGAIQNDGNSENSNLDLLESRKKQVDSLLGNLKSLITDSKARYIFIAGREMYDSYLSERGDTSSLYESLFSHYIYIPSLFSDKSDGSNTILDSMIEVFVVNKILPTEIFQSSPRYKYLIDYSKMIQKYGRKHNTKDQYVGLKDREADEIFILKGFIHFLAFHSWGNYKRLINLLETFVVDKSVLEEKEKVKAVSIKKSEANHYLVFTTVDLQRFLLSSHLYISFHHYLSRILLQADDKLVVSTFAIFHYILKFHNFGFSRAHINRMYETINAHSSPELTHIIDTILGDVLRNHIRRIRNGFYRFRFSSLFEQEIHYITKVSDKESASFNFSLDASRYLKKYYSDLLNICSASEAGSLSSVAQLNTIIGYFNFWEQSYDKANIYFESAAHQLRKQLEIKFCVNTLLQYVEALLKQASVAERMGNYPLAAAYFVDANKIVESNYYNLRDLQLLDSKWDVLKQPYWGFLFLNLKRSVSPYRDVNSRPKCFFKSMNHNTYFYRMANFSFLIDNYEESLDLYLRVIHIKNEPECVSERHAYLRGYSLIKASLCLVHLSTSQLLKSGSEWQEILEFVNSNLKNIEAKNNLSDFGSGLKSAKKNVIIVAQTNPQTTVAHVNGVEIKTDCVLEYAIGLCFQAVALFEKSGLHTHTVFAYINIMVIWQAFVDMIPVRAYHYDNTTKQSFKIDANNCLKDVNNLICGISKKEWLVEVRHKALLNCGQSTEQAYSHSTKAMFARNLCRNLMDDEFFCKPLVESITNESFTNHFAFQHFSMLGQTVIAIANWSAATPKYIECEKINRFKEVLPYSVRYYATMTWLNGRNSICNLNKKINEIHIKNRQASYMNKLNHKEDFEDLIDLAFYAIRDLYNSAQNLAMSSNNSFSLTLPPYFLINYNQWEVLASLTLVYKAVKFKDVTDYVNSYLTVRSDLDSIFCKFEKGMSSRVLDLKFLAQQAREQMNIVIRIADVNSRERVTIFNSMYYLDDDYEDMMFNIDWAYGRCFIPGAILHKSIIDKEMALMGFT